jgi:hypothetical protein
MINILDILNTEKARINFIKGLIYISKAKEMREGLTGVETEELIFFRNAMISLQIDEKTQKELEEIINYTDITIDIAFDNKKQSLFFLREGIQICYVDGVYYDAEKDMIKEMADKLGIGMDIIEKIEKWVLEGIEWTKQGEKFLEMEV